MGESLTHEVPVAQYRVPLASPPYTWLLAQRRCHVTLDVRGGDRDRGDQLDQPAAFGAYTYFVPSSWVLADLSEAWYLSSWIGGGVLLAAGFGLLGASVRDRSGYWTSRAIASFVVATLALAGAVAAAVLLIV